MGKHMKIFIFIFILFNITSAEILDIDRVRRVIDGDTIVVDLRCKPDILCKNMKIRLVDIDTPEIRTKDKNIKRKGLIAKHQLREEIRRGDYLELRKCSRGKYFRLVCDLRINGLSASELMISGGYARYYDGGTKIIWK